MERGIEDKVWGNCDEFEATDIAPARILSLLHVSFSSVQFAMWYLKFIPTHSSPILRKRSLRIALA